MSDDLLLKAERRSKVGSVDSQRLRAAGRVPANVYGLGKPVVSASVCSDTVGKLVSTLSSVVDLELDGTVDKAVVQELQWDVFSTKVIHVDLRRVDPNGRATVDVKLELRGEAVGLKDGGAVRQLAKTVKIDCPDYRIPKSIVVRMGALQIGDTVKVSDLQVPDYVNFVTPKDEVLVELYDARKAVV
ncbi:MAG: 50S ribosomal protein L25 [Planctomycetaceae bacterium]|nr:50S ribosomal protein L25 [Planctomycetaceae bacterium]